jgi:hypothetical protein
MHVPLGRLGFRGFAESYPTHRRVLVVHPGVEQFNTALRPYKGIQLAAHNSPYPSDRLAGLIKRSPELRLSATDPFSQARDIIGKASMWALLPRDVLVAIREVALAARNIRPEFARQYLHRLDDKITPLPTPLTKGLAAALTIDNPRPGPRDFTQLSHGLADVIHINEQSADPFDGPTNFAAAIRLASATLKHLQLLSA